jgi:hypothetical protein
MPSADSTTQLADAFEPFDCRAWLNLYNDEAQLPTALRILIARA